MNNDVFPSTISISTNAFAFNSKTTVIESIFYDDAKGIPVWEEAMQKELDALEANNTGDVVPLSKHKGPIACRRVYKIKLLADGSIERHKAPLVAK